MIFKNMLTMQGMMFLNVTIGFIIRRKGIVGTEGRKDMVDLCLYVTLPFNCENRRKTLRYGTIVSNGGFLGNPVVEGIYGTEHLFYASIFMFPVRIVM